MGKKVNRLINNNWLRTKLEQNLQKHCYINEIEFVKINPCYSSFIGNVLHGKQYPDPICSAIEIGRRGHFKFVKDKFYPKLVMHKNLPNRWKEEIDNSYKSWVELFNKIKKVGLRYRFSWKDTPERIQVFSLNNKKSLINLNYLV
jgi:hypothetical protein